MDGTVVTERRSYGSAKAVGRSFVTGILTNTGPSVAKFCPIVPSQHSPSSQRSSVILNSSVRLSKPSFDSGDTTTLSQALRHEDLDLRADASGSGSQVVDCLHGAGAFVRYENAVRDIVGRRGHIHIVHDVVSTRLIAYACYRNPRCFRRIKNAITYC